jgi:hypothetical protein
LGISQITLIDPDVVEIHNLGEMDAVTSADIGRPKAEAIADYLRLVAPNLPVSLFPLSTSIANPAAQASVKSCDVLIVCADNDAARLATAIIATMYHKVLVDIGTGVHFTGSNDEIRNPQEGARRSNRIMGADIRLVLPGEGCLLCVGNLRHYQQAVEDLCNLRLPHNLKEEWRQQRAGSLRTLNQIAAHIGVQMLQDLVAERLQTSTWAHVEFDDVGRLTVSYPNPKVPDGTCALCAKAGLGDEGLGFPQ